MTRHRILFLILVCGGLAHCAVLDFVVGPAYLASIEPPNQGALPGFMDPVRPSLTHLWGRPAAPPVPDVEAGSQAGALSVPPHPVPAEPGRADARHLGGQLGLGSPERAPVAPLKSNGDTKQVSPPSEGEGDPALTLDFGPRLLMFNRATRHRAFAIARRMKASPTQRLVLVGYADELGTAEANRELSLRRAQVVRDYLANLGVPAARVEVLGRGADAPGTRETDGQPGGRNRRVAVIWR